MAAQEAVSGLIQRREVHLPAHPIRLLDGPTTESTGTGSQRTAAQRKHSYSDLTPCSRTQAILQRNSGTHHLGTSPITGKFSQIGASRKQSTTASAIRAGLPAPTSGSPARSGSSSQGSAPTARVSTRAIDDGTEMTCCVTHFCIQEIVGFAAFCRREFGIPDQSALHGLISAAACSRRASIPPASTRAAASSLGLLFHEYGDVQWFVTPALCTRFDPPIVA
jgi:hypothetical protein